MRSHSFFLLYNLTDAVDRNIKGDENCFRDYDIIGAVWVRVRGLLGVFFIKVLVLLRYRCVIGILFISNSDVIALALSLASLLVFNLSLSLL